MPRFLSLLLAFALILSTSCSNNETQGAFSLSESSGKSSKLTLEQVSARVFVVGQVAETTLEITFRNRTDRDLETHLDLPLPEGASISSYALEVNGTMREGVIVEKQLGRVAFESTTRRNIDPGLLEKVGGNRFRTRIYPVPAKGTKRVRLSYLQPLTGKRPSYHYQLPLPTKKRIDDFSFHIAANDPRTLITPEQKGGLYIATKNHRPGILSFQITPSEHSTDAFVQRGRDGKRYFHLTDHPHDLTEGKRSAPRKILLVWDASHSGNLRDSSQELSLLDAYFQSIPGTQVDLRILRDTLVSAGTFHIDNGNWSSLRETLHSLKYDGATRLDHVDLRAPGYDQVFFISDGLSTFGTGKLRYGKCPIFTINSSPQADHRLLEQLALETEGAYLNLPSHPSQDTLRQLTHQSMTLLRVTGAGVSQLVLNTKAGVSTVQGRLTKKATTLTLHYGTNGTTRLKRTVRLKDSGRKSTGNIAPKLWAQGKIDQLNIAAKANKAEIIALAKAHHLVTAHTSLIVLDRLEDYLTYGIVPPEAKMRKQYFAQRRDQELFDGSRKADLNEVYRDWKELVAWHKGRFPRRPKGQEGEDDDFISPVDFTPIPPPSVELPFFGGGAIGGADVSGIVTAGLRSGDYAVNRNSIDAILNNPRRSPSSSISIKGWQSDAPYLRAYRKAVQSERSLLPIYFQWKKKYHQSPGFYLESADFFAQQNQPALARRILSNLAELSPESPEFLRILAHRYSQLGEHVLAEMLFREVADMRAEEPQSHRDLALALINLKRYREAEKLLWRVISRQWGGRFEGIDMIALNEWNHLHQKRGSRLPIRKSQKRFRHRLDTDIRILISWDTDNSDMDLWVTDPTGEKCYYANSNTKAGGRISDDFTDGRGPEEFMIRKAPLGTYKIQANYYGTRQQTSIGPTTLHATVITNWGRKNEKRQHLTFQLGSTKEVVEVGEVEFQR